MTLTRTHRLWSAIEDYARTQDSEATEAIDQALYEINEEWKASVKAAGEREYDRGCYEVISELKSQLQDLRVNAIDIAELGEEQEARARVLATVLLDEVLLSLRLQEQSKAISARVQDYVAALNAAKVKWLESVQLRQPVTKDS